MTSQSRPPRVNCPARTLASTSSGYDPRASRPVAGNKQDTSNNERHPPPAAPTGGGIRRQDAERHAVSLTRNMRDRTYKQEVPGSSPGLPIGGTPTHGRLPIGGRPPSRVSSP